MVTKGRNDGLKEIHRDIFELLPRYKKFFVFITISVIIP